LAIFILDPHAIFFGLAVASFIEEEERNSFDQSDGFLFGEMPDGL
jgi:hypothetical protein